MHPDTDDPPLGGMNHVTSFASSTSSLLEPADSSPRAVRYSPVCASFARMAAKEEAHEVSDFRLKNVPKLQGLAKSIDCGSRKPTMTKNNAEMRDEIADKGWGFSTSI